MSIKKAVIPVAGLGTRLLPATKALPKEMFPLVDAPVIQHIVEEAVQSGITEILMITSEQKDMIRQHFSRDLSLEHHLERKQQQTLAQRVRRISEIADIKYVTQQPLNGLGDAIYLSKSFVGNEPFVVLLGDSVMRSKTPVTAQLIHTYQQLQNMVIGVQQVSQEQVSRYGIIDGTPLGNDLYQIKRVVEKPAVNQAPSRLAIAARYILTPEIFDYLEQTPKGVSNEIQLTDAIQSLLKAQQVYARLFEGQRFDIGNKLDFIRANIVFGLDQPDINAQIRECLSEFY